MIFVAHFNRAGTNFRQIVKNCALNFVTANRGGIFQNDPAVFVNLLNGQSGFFGEFTLRAI